MPFTFFLENFNVEFINIIAHTKLKYNTKVFISYFFQVFILCVDYYVCSKGLCHIKSALVNIS